MYIRDSNTYVATKFYPIKDGAKMRVCFLGKKGQLLKNTLAANLNMCYHVALTINVIFVSQDDETLISTDGNSSCFSNFYTAFFTGDLC